MSFVSFRVNSWIVVLARSKSDPRKGHEASSRSRNMLGTLVIQTVRCLERSCYFIFRGTERALVQ